MTEQQYDDFIREQHRLAREDLDRRLLQLRRRLWPPHGFGLFHEDPIDVDDRRRRDRVALALRSMPIVNRPSAATIIAVSP